MSFITCYDDDPNDGPAGYRTYEVVPLEHVMAPTREGWRQKSHPMDAMRRHGLADVGLSGDSTQKTPCLTPGCFNRGTAKSQYCSTCKRHRRPVYLEAGR